MSRIYDVAVLGAGVAGSSLAKSLADRGWEAVLIDGKQFPRHKVCGEFLSPESQSTLRAMGLHHAVEALQPSLITQARLIFQSGAPLELPLPGVALGVSRYLLDGALHRAAINSGVELKAAATVTAVHPAPRGYVIETKQGESRLSYEARAVIAAWGANCRAGLPGHRAGARKDKAYIGVKSHFAGIEMEPAVELYVFDGGYLGISTIEHGIVNVAALLARKAFPPDEKTVLGLLAAAARRNPRLSRKLADAVPVPGTQAAVAPVALSRKPQPWAAVPHIGDAALMLPPLCGDGMSLALRSAALCAPLADRFLAGSLSLAQWEQAYSQAMRQEFQAPLQWGRLLQWLFGIPLLPRLLLGAAQLAPGMVAQLVRATRLKEKGV